MSKDEKRLTQGTARKLNIRLNKLGSEKYSTGDIIFVILCILVIIICLLPMVNLLAKSLS